MARFCVPRDVFFGRDTLCRLIRLRGERALFVVEDAPQEEDATMRAAAYLQDAGMRVRVLRGVGAEASVREVRNGVKAMREFRPDWIVAMGGGTLIDAAKVMWVLYANPAIALPDIEAFSLDVVNLRATARFAAVPTSAGTGTEAAGSAALADYVNCGCYVIRHSQLTPDMVILDPVVMHTASPLFTAYAGMRAISNALETSVTPARTLYTEPFAVRALRILFADVLPSYKGDATAQERVLYAQYMAGMAYANSSLGLNRALSLAVSACFTKPHIPDGCATAILLPHIVRFNANVIAARYAELAGLLSVEQEGKSASEALAARLGEISAQMRIPHSFSRFGVPEDVFEQALPIIAELAERLPGTKENPRPASRDQLIKLLRCAYTGKPADF